jgi:hypothetical protein
MLIMSCTIAKHLGGGIVGWVTFAGCSNEPERGQGGRNGCKNLI